MKVLVENSTWNNIGDGFYQTSIKNILKRLFPQWDIAEMDGPITRAFRPKGFTKNAFHLNQIQSADIYVFSGPILSGGFLKEYGDLIKNIINGGKKYCILSAHGNGDSLGANKEFLAKYPPVVLTTRDKPTFDFYKDVAKSSYNGVCAALLVSKTCNVADIIEEHKNYITISFYDAFEPDLKYEKDKLTPDVHPNDNILRHPKWKYWRHLEFLKKSPEKIGPFKIIRPVHDIGYKFLHLSFSKPNSFLSYNPLSYLSIYKNTSLTISNRIHAILPTLSFGRPAIYYGNEKRDALFDRIKFSQHTNTVLKLPEEYINEEYESLKKFLLNAVW